MYLIMQVFGFFWGSLNFLNLRVWDCFFKGRENKKPHSNISHTWNCFLYLGFFSWEPLGFVWIFPSDLTIFWIGRPLKHFIPYHLSQTYLPLSLACAPLQSLVLQTSILLASGKIIPFNSLPYCLPRKL